MSVGLVEVGFVSLSLIQSDYAGISPARQNILVWVFVPSRIKVEQIVSDKQKKIVINNEGALSYL